MLNAITIKNALLASLGIVLLGIDAILLLIAQLGTNLIGALNAYNVDKTVIIAKMPTYAQRAHKDFILITLQENVQLIAQPGTMEMSSQECAWYANLDALHV